MSDVNENTRAPLPTHTIDVVIIGGGIHGCALACEASSRGLSTLLLEADDLASGSSSRSHRIIGGGLDQLEQLDLDAVNRGLQEQAILRRRAPHLIRSHRFQIQANTQLRSRLKIKLGLTLYRKLQRRQQLPNEEIPADANVDGALSYCDDSVDDSRLNLALAQQAQSFGAQICTRLRLLKAKRIAGHWQIDVANQQGQIQPLTAKILINAAGEAINTLMAKHIEQSCRGKGLLIRDDYLVLPHSALAAIGKDTPQLLQGEKKQLVYLLDYPVHDSSDNRYWTLGPWQTIANNHADFDKETAEHANLKLLELFNKTFHDNNPFAKGFINSASIKHRFHAIRNLCEDASCAKNKTSGDYALDLDSQDGRAPLLTVFGGTITTHRLLAEQALNILQAFTNKEKNPQLKQQALPGGDFSEGDLPALEQELAFNYPNIDPTLLQRFARSYGSNSHKVLNGIATDTELGQHFGAGLYQKEVEYLCSHEWARTAEDILWRRTKLGLTTTTNERDSLEKWLDKNS